MVQRQFDIQALSTQIPDIERAVVEAYEYLKAARRPQDDPDDDLISRSPLHARSEGDRLSHDESSTSCTTCSRGSGYH